MAINLFGISERCSILRFPRASDRNFWLLTDPGAGVGERIHDGFTSTVAWLKKSGYLLKGIQLAFFSSQGLWRSNCIKFSSLGRRFVHFFLSSTGQIRCYLREVQGNIFGIYHGVIFQSLRTWTIGFPNFLFFFSDFQSFSSHLSVSQNQVMRYTLSGCHWMGKNGTTLFRVFPSFFQKPIYESPLIAHWISVFSCFKPSIYH